MDTGSIQSGDLRTRTVRELICPKNSDGGGGGIRTHGDRYSRTAFRERHLKPLGHPSGANYTIEHGSYSGSPPAANLGFKMHEFIESLMRCRHHEIVSYGLVETRGLNPALSFWKSRMLSASCATSSPA